MRGARGRRGGAARPRARKAKGPGEMIGFHKRPSPAVVLAWAIFALAWNTPFTPAQEPAPAPKPAPAQPAQDPDTPAKPQDTPAKKDGAGQKFDPAVVSAGQAAFERGCVKCHDAARALERTKDLAGWRATVKRMAARRGADIPTADIEPIAVYL